MKPQPPSRIVFVTPGGVEAGGGMGRITGYIVDELSRRGQTGDLVVLDPRGGGSVLASPWHLLRACARLLAMALRGEVAVVHVNTSERLSYPRKGLLMQLARLLGLPVIAHMHGADFMPYFDRASALERWWVRRVLRTSQKVVVLGDSFRRHAIEQVGLPAAQVVTVFNAIPDLRREQPQSARRPLPFAAGRPARLLMLANISARKGADSLLTAAAALRAAGHDFHLTLAGGGEIRQFQTMAAELGLAPVTDFPGWVDRAGAHRLLLEADALVLPSRAEGLPIAILEALALGTPIVTTPVGAIPEVLRDGETALIVPPGDAASLTAALARLITGATSAAALAEAGRRLYERSFAIEGFCDRWLALYAEAIGALGRPLPAWAAAPATAARAA